MTCGMMEWHKHKKVIIVVRIKVQCMSMDNGPRSRGERYGTNTNNNLLSKRKGACRMQTPIAHK